MRANRVSAYVFAVAASLGGCTGTGTGDVEYSGQVQVSSPELVEISPGVQVIADADEPLFYSDGNYWLYRDGYWLRSDDYRSGFVRVDVTYVPERVRVIDRPQVYVQYRRRHQRDYEARMGQQTRSRSATPQGTYDPPPNQGVPSTPGADTWQRGDQPRPYPPAASPTVPAPTPPLVSPNDVHGNPMPTRQMLPVNVERPHGDRGPEHAPPGQAGRPGAGPGPQPVPVPPSAQNSPDDRGHPGNGNGTRPDDHGNGARPDDHGNAKVRDDRANNNRPEDHGTPEHGDAKVRDDHTNNATDRDDRGTSPKKRDNERDKDKDNNKSRNH